MLRVAIVAVLLLGVLSAWNAVTSGPPYPVPVTDFNRDYIGAAAANRGLNPYQLVGQLGQELGIDTEGADGYWVAHTPFSIALARLTTLSLNIDQANNLALAASLAAYGFLLLWLVRASYGDGWWIGAGLTGAILLSEPFRSDVFWVQGASIGALLIGLAFQLLRKGRLGIARFLFGAAIAWRPWLAPLVLLIPKSRAAFHDAAIAAGWAVGLTLASIPFAGGMAGFTAWITTALPQNAATYQGFEWNLSAIRSVPNLAIASLLWGLGTILLAVNRSHFRRNDWPLVASLSILTLSPIVWPSYWIYLLVPLFLDAGSGRVRAPMISMLASLLLVAPLHGGYGLTMGLLSVGACLVLAMSLVRDGPASHMEFQSS